MAQKRKLNPNFFIADRFLDLSKDAQLLFFHIVVSAYDCGNVNNANTLFSILNCSESALNELIDYSFLEKQDDEVFKYKISNWEDVCGKNDRNTNNNLKWKKSVLERDKHKCAKCGSTEDLNVHHILSFAKYPEARYDIDNGITLCYDCHLAAHGKKRKSK